MRKLIGILSVVLVLLVGVGVLLYTGVLDPKDAAPTAPETALAASTAPSTEPETEPPTTTEPQPELSARDEAVIFDGVELETYDCEGETVVRATDFLAASGADDGGAASESGAPAIAVSEDGSSVTVGQRTFRTVVDGEVYLPLDQVVSTLGYPTWVDDEDGTTYITRSFEITPDVNVPILEYHAVGDDCWGYEELFARPDRLEELFGFLNDNGYDPIWFEDLAHLQDYDKPVMLTFDDGYDDNYTILFPLLKKYNIKATVFVITADIGGNHKLTADQIREMSDSGLVSIQSHTNSHTDLNALSAEEQELEFSESKKILTRITGKIPYVLCYPTGRYDNNTLTLARKYYTFGVKMVGGLYNTSDDPFLVNRYYVSRYANLSTVRSYLSAAGT